MGDRVRIYLGHKNNTTEGHTKQCMAFFNLRPIWGFPEPISCHDNTIEIKRALEAADSRFILLVFDKPHSVEGHRATIDIKKGNKYYLRDLSTHENMRGLAEAVDNALDKAGTTFGAEEKATALDAEEEEQRESMTRSKALAYVIIKPQDIPERMKKLRDELPIKSENPLSMQLGFELIDSFEFHRYFDEIYMTYPVLWKLGNQLLLLLTWQRVEFRSRSLSSWLCSEEGEKAHEQNRENSICLLNYLNEMLDAD